MSPHSAVFRPENNGVLTKRAFCTIILSYAPRICLWFLRKKGGTPVKRVTFPAMLLVLALLLTACAAGQKSFQRGSVEGQTYTSDFLGLTCTAPETYSYLSDEEIAGLVGCSPVIQRITNASVTLTWNAVAGAQGYRVFRAPAESPGEWIQLTAAPLSVRTFTDRSVVPGSAYLYRIGVQREDGTVALFDPNTAAVPSESLVSQGKTASAGSPGPFESIMPSGLYCIISLHVVLYGTVITSQPRDKSSRRMFAFAPKSHKTTRRLGFSHFSVYAFLQLTCATGSLTVYFSISASFALAASADEVIIPFITPCSLIIFVSALVSMP